MGFEPLTVFPTIQKVPSYKMYIDVFFAYNFAYMNIFAYILVDHHVNLKWGGTSIKEEVGY